MAQVRTIVKVCDRCPFGKEKPATTRRQFAIEDRYYELDLCEPHGEAHDRDLGVWTRLAREIDSPYSNSLKPLSMTFTKEHAEKTHSVITQSSELQQQAEQSLFAKKQAERIAAEIEEHAYKTIPGARKWTLTRHARERMMERNFTPAEVLMAVTIPGTTLPDPERRPDVVICKRGDCKVAVNARTHVILTVIDRTQQDESKIVDNRPRQRMSAAN